jgi:cytochrome b561
MKKNILNHASPTRYGAVAQLFHWITAILVLIAFIYGPGGSEARVYSVGRAFDRQLHETLGLCVLALTVLRIVWSAFDSRPVPAPGPRWMVFASRAVQGCLYLLLLALPCTAISGAWLTGHPLTLMGGIEVPALLGVSRDLGQRLANLHGWLGDAIVWIAGFHALAAIFHHLVLKDRVLLSMLPAWLGFRTLEQDPGLASRERQLK